mmetsp:Transcript_14395/g.60078  ORF Transcript_14395/g.60078 Transcript_14395/m.60078 type:complete len:225 (+) Transcript_14395:723-1397(+)
MWGWLGCPTRERARCSPPPPPPRLKWRRTRSLRSCPTSGYSRARRRRRREPQTTAAASTIRSPSTRLPVRRRPRRRRTWPAGRVRRAEARRAYRSVRPCLRTYPGLSPARTSARASGASSYATCGARACCSTSWTAPLRIRSGITTLFAGSCGCTTRSTALGLTWLHSTRLTSRALMRGRQRSPPPWRLAPRMRPSCVTQTRRAAAPIQTVATPACAGRRFVAS